MEPAIEDILEAHYQFLRARMPMSEHDMRAWLKLYDHSFACLLLGYAAASAAKEARLKSGPSQEWAQRNADEQVAWGKAVGYFQHMGWIK